jgi:hypothetical protein
MGRLEVFTAMNKNMAVFWGVALCSVVDIH